MLIRNVQRGGPADRAGIAVRDVVLEIGGRPTRNTPALLSQVAALQPGSSTKVTLMREGRQLDVDVVVGRRPRP